MLANCVIHPFNKRTYYVTGICWHWEVAEGKPDGALSHGARTLLGWRGLLRVNSHNVDVREESRAWTSRLHCRVSS